MIKITKRQRGVSNVSAIAHAGDIFGKYKRETPHEVRAPDVKEDVVLKELRNIWNKFAYGQDNEDAAYVRVLGLIGNLSVSAKDVEKFVIALIEFQDEKWFAQKTGLLLSALINTGSEENYTVDSRYLIKPPNDATIYDLGFRNVKNIIIYGNDVTRIGHKMERGTIIVRGDASAFAALEMQGGIIIVEGYGDYGSGSNMHGGELIIKGDAGPYIGGSMTGGRIHVYGNAPYQEFGRCMKGGLIVIEGNCGHDTGLAMEGGEIHLNGDYHSLGVNKMGGKVFHKGKLIYPVNNDAS